MPEKFTTILSDSKYNWNYNTIPQKMFNNREIYYPRGKVLGGSSSLNAMIYIRGHPLDYERWTKEGALGWSYADCLPYFKKSQSHVEGENLYRGGKGPLKVTSSKAKDSLNQAFIKAGLQAGYGSVDDFNGFRQEGFGKFDVTIYNGQRWSTATAYLKPVSKNKNLTVTTETLVTKIIFDGKRAVGVEILDKQGQLERVMANKEVILSGGAINSPHLLMLSGIGDGDMLKKNSIDIVQHIPGVGKNLQDHLLISVIQKCQKPISSFSQKSPFKMKLINLQWHLFKSGIGTNAPVESGAFLRSEAGIAHPDIQYFFATIMHKDHSRAPEKLDVFQIALCPLRPQSKGSISIQSIDPRKHPIIDFNYCSHPNDLNLMRKGIRLGQEIFAQVAFDELRGGEIFPGKHFQTDSQVDEFIKIGSQHIYHAACSCKMGSTKDNDVVVDSQCRVVGLDGLRVVDASIMPSIVSGNTNAPTIMIAEKAADIILGNPSLAKIENVPIWSPKYPHLQRESN